MISQSRGWSLPPSVRALCDHGHAAHMVLVPSAPPAGAALVLAGTALDGAAAGGEAELETLGVGMSAGRPFFLAMLDF